MSDAIDLHAPFGVQPGAPGTYAVTDARGTIVSSCSDAGLAYTVALAMNEIAQGGTRTLRSMCSFTTEHPQGGTIEVRIPRDVPGARDDYFDVAIARLRGFVEGVERVRRERLSGKIGAA